MKIKEDGASVLLRTYAASNNMKIAVTYDNGQVFRHFGRTEQFKIYDVEDDEILSSEVMDTNGVGHEALAELLAEHDIDALICGGMGAGAQTALIEAGIDVCSGAEGDVDEAVKAYIRGELVSSGVNCDHHDEEEHSCGGNCGGCSGCGGGRPTIMLEGPNAGKTVKVHYCGTFNDGSQFDSSYDRGEPLEFICGAGMMIPGFDMAVVDMKVGEIKNVHLSPAEAYGMPDPELVVTYALSDMPGAEELEVGGTAYLYDIYGRPVPVKVVALDEENITFDANHEMAGRELNFKIELVEVND